MDLAKLRARLEEISAELDGITASADGYSAEQAERVEALNTEFEETSKQIETAEKIEAMKSRATTSTGRKTQATTPTTPAVRVEVGRTLNERFGGFNSSGEFLMAVKKFGQTGELAKQFQNATAYERVGEDGGFLVPEEISQTILKKLEVEESLMSKTTSLQVSGNAMSINVDESQPWNQGIQAYWTEEGGLIQESKPSFKRASWRLNKLACLIKATDELLDDATALESYIKQAAPDAFMHKINAAILAGNGVGKPSGIIGSPFTVTVPKESMQTADTINANNILKMYSRMFPGSLGRAAWYCNAGVQDQLRLMTDANDEYIYLSPGGTAGQMSASPYGTLLGRPVIPMLGSMPALGDLGDIIFADLSYYYMIRKAAGIKSATSIHLLFDREITTFRFSMRLDGGIPFKAPVTTEYGNFQVSAFVQLEAR